LIHRLEENHNDKYRKYERESIRLKKKYQNILSKLTHEQLIEMKRTENLISQIYWLIDLIYHSQKLCKLLDIDYLFCKILYSVTPFKLLLNESKITKELSQWKNIKSIKD
jgi:hypothetical protein